MHNQTELINLCLQQDRAAQKALYLHYADTMMAVCFRYTKSQADAEDVMQEGFVRVFKYLHQYRQEGDLGGWIRRIIVNTALNNIKKNKRYKEEIINRDTALPEQFVSSNAMAAIDGKEVAELIRKLPSGYQTVFNLHAIEGYSHVEIASMLGIAEGTSRSQYARARKILADAITSNHKQSEKTGYAAK